MSERSLEPHELWIEQCVVGRGIREHFGVKTALDYIVGDKLLTFTKKVQERQEFAEKLPAFVAETHRIFTFKEIWDYINHLKPFSDREILRDLYLSLSPITLLP